MEIRIDAGYRTVADVDVLFDAIDVQVRKLPTSQRIVTAADWRQCPLMNGDAAERVLKRIVKMNPRTERSSALASPGSPTAVLQFMRLIREARLADRRMFFDAEEQIAWLAEVLTEDEAARLREFLTEDGLEGSSYTRVIEPPAETRASIAVAARRQR